MAIINAREGVQYPVIASGIINWDDTETDGTSLATHTVTHSLTLATLPGNAVVIGGAIVVLTAWTGVTAGTIDIGDDDPTADPDRYTPTPLDLDDAVATLAITPLGYRTTAVCNLTADIIGTVADATAGQLAWWVEYIVTPGRTHEAIG